MYHIDLTELPQLTNDTFYPLYNNDNRYLVLMGGGGSGKSVFAAQKIIYRVLTEDNHKILVVRKVAKTSRQSTFSLLRAIINSWGLSELFSTNKTEMEITCKNGNQIIHAGLDDVEKLKSIQGVTSIWIEEASELLPEDFRQLDIRLRGQTKNYKQIILTFNPVSITHWLKKEFFDTKKPKAVVSKTTYKDNKFLPKEDIEVLEGFKESDPYYYQVYCLGQWGVTGKTIFNSQKVSIRIHQLANQKPLSRGYFIYSYENEKIVDKSIRFIPDETGYITIHEDVKENYPYVIGGDTAGEGSDYFAGQVLDNTTGKQVAILHHQFDEDLYTKQMYCLGKHYNMALIGIETNYSTYPTMELSRLGYYKQYNREVPDTFTGKLQKKYGFHTTKLTRPVIISNGVEIVREATHILNDIKTLEEMLTFVRNEQGRAEAQEGSHDDLIMSWLIAQHIREQQTFNVSEVPIKPPEKLLDKLGMTKNKKSFKTI